MLQSGKNLIYSWALKLESPLENDGIMKMFYRVFYAVVFVLLLMQIPGLDLFYGSNKMVPPFPYNEGAVSYVFHLLGNNPDLMIPFYVALLVGCLIAVFRQSFWLSLLVWILFLNHYNAGYLLMNSGDMILSNFMLFMAVFVYKPQSSFYRNLGLWLMRLQVVLIYLISILFKLEGHDWPQGEALHYVSLNVVFGSEFLRSFPDWLLVLMTYIVLIHQMMFPVLIWFRRLRLKILLLGAAIHLGIMFIMGLYDFGLIMILVYIPFLEESDISVFRKFYRKIRLLPGK